MNIKMTTNSQLQLNLKNKLSKQEQEQNHRYGDHLEGYQLGWERGKMGERCKEKEVQIGRYRIDREMVKTVQEMEWPKNLYA